MSGGTGYIIGGIAHHNDLSVGTGFFEDIANDLVLAVPGAVHGCAAEKIEILRQFEFFQNGYRHGFRLRGGQNQPVSGITQRGK